MRIGTKEDGFDGVIDEGLSKLREQVGMSSCSWCFSPLLNCTVMIIIFVYVQKVCANVGNVSICGAF